MKERSNLIKVLIILIIFTVAYSYQNRQNRSGFDFEQKWEWKTLEAYSTNSETHNKIDSLKEQLSIEEARSLFHDLSSLNNPEDILQLYAIQAIQDSLGGSFYGLAPAFSRKTDSIPIPFDFDNLISAGLYLAKFRARSYQAIVKTGYPLDFTHEKLMLPLRKDNSPHISLVFDMSPVKQTLDAFTKNHLTLKQTNEISHLEGFKEMLAHRCNLGYIPEPLPTEKSLAQFILYASSDEPLNRLWKWLSPWNYFNLSDLYLNQIQYQNIIKVLEKKDNEIGNLISTKIDPFVPKDFKYKDTLSIAVNWGIRSWATDKTLGTNIVQFKDNYTLLIQTLSHETFHKIQLKLCPTSPLASKKDNKSFEDIVNYSFADKKDEKFYQILSYIFLEGTATFIGGINASENLEVDAEKGVDLLKKIYTEIYYNNNLEAVDALLNTGLKSNGPFYSLGYELTEEILRHSDSDVIRNLLKNGTLEFFMIYHGLETEKRFVLDDNIKNKIIELSGNLDDYQY